MRSAVALVLFLLVLARGEERAERMVEAGDLAAAEVAYRELVEAAPADPRLNYNLGTVLLLQGRFPDARAPLETARRGTDDDLRWRSAYNLGNSDLEPAFSAPDLPDREARLRSAIDSYKQALLLDPTDEDAKWNLELAQRLLERDPPPDGGGGEGTGGGGSSAASRPDPSPGPADGAGPQPRFSPAAVEELLNAAQDREREIQRERLRRPQPPGTIAH